MVDREALSEIIGDGRILGNRCIMREGYVFTAITEPGNVYDAIVILNPNNIRCLSPRFPNSPHTLMEHIDLINSLKLEKAFVFGMDIGFLPKCPTLKYLNIVPSPEAGDKFDFAPLYAMPEIIQLHCAAEYGNRGQYCGNVDYLRINGLKRLSISGRGHLNYQNVTTLQCLSISGYKGKNADLTDLIGSEQLEELRMIQCRNKSLNGIQQSKCIRSIELSYNRSLADISQLTLVKNTLKNLSIENCPQITDFSCLPNLVNLEYMRLFGKNTLPDLTFLTSLPRLKRFDFSMDVADGDLSPCVSVPYVSSMKDRKHFNLKNVDLPKTR